MAAPKETKKAAAEKKTQTKMEKYFDRAVGNAMGSAGSAVGRSVMNKFIKGLFK